MSGTEQVFTGTHWWHKEGDKIACDLCPRGCVLPEGKRGFCFVRQNVGGEMALTTYGRSTGFCIDPVEKKPLNHFLPGTPILSFGTAGCNLGCKFCQNWDISKAREIEILSSYASPEAVALAAKKHGCRSIAFTYNDPVIWAEYAIDTAKAARDAGLKTVAVTAGYITPSARPDFYRWMDAANVDLKAFSEAFYKNLTLSHIEPVLDTLKWLKHESDVWFEITNLVIPGENDSEDEIARMCDWIAANLGDDVPVHFSAFHPDYKMTDHGHTSRDTLRRARRQALAAGLRYAYVGNVYDRESESTYCPHCRHIVIERDWYELGEYRLDGNHCSNCSSVIAGVFEGRPGDWGRKRLPVSIPAAVQMEDQMSEGSGFWERLRKRRSARREETAAPVKRPSPAAEPPVDAKPAVREAAAAEQKPPPAPAKQEPKEEAKPVTKPAAAKERKTAADNVKRKKSLGESFTNISYSPKTDFKPEEADLMRRYVRSVVNSAISGAPFTEKLTPELAASPAYGVFVTLERGKGLRACRGRWGAQESSTLAELLSEAAKDSATFDPRFPSIHQAELPFLSIEISLMHDPKLLAQKGKARTSEIKVGEHGIAIMHPAGRGLLLPQVAVEHKWNEETFLDQVAVKAGLPPKAWLEDEAEIISFRGLLLQDAAPAAELDFAEIQPQMLAELLQLANFLSHEQQGEIRLPRVLATQFAGQLGVELTTADGLRIASFNANSSLFENARGAVLSLIEMRQKKPELSRVVHRLAVFGQPLPLRAADYPNRCYTLQHHAILLQAKQGSQIFMPHGTDTIGEALAAAGAGLKEWSAEQLKLTAYTARAVELRPEQQGLVRRAAVSGRFYPGERKEIESLLSTYLAAAGARPKRKYAAVMVPHAGWVYCGETIGKTLQSAEIPETALLIGPKHHAQGARWSAAPHDLWDIAGDRIPLARDLIRRLTSINGIVAEPAAHEQEHCLEVIVPFLRRLNPAIKIAPLLMGHSSFEETAALAEALAAMLRDLPNPPLLVISTDMNHYAPEPANRQKDQLALQAMVSGNARALFDVCQREGISMCGMIPAVTVMQAVQKLRGSLKVELVDYRTSAQASGDSSAVVGYAGALLDA